MLHDESTGSIGTRIREDESTAHTAAKSGAICTVPTGDWDRRTVTLPPAFHALVEPASSPGAARRDPSRPAGDAANGPPPVST